MKPILEVQGLGKRYRIHHQHGVYLSLRERLGDMLRARRSSLEDFWALRDVSFKIAAGQSVGFIGKNGAGKSTLLKILSRISPPTKGSFTSRGRVASLLEVGTGFHPELTGRENIWFNGSLLGMKKKEIAAKFDEIVDFSGVEKFLDTPLKHYSSGMQLRLAFAVAAFLEPEILVVDEVLAVGDAEFQRKCMGKMEAVTKSGRTILFVSHNLSAVETLCSRVIHLREGTVYDDGAPSTVLASYLKLSAPVVHTTAKLSAYPADEYMKFSSVNIIQDGVETMTIQNSKMVQVQARYTVTKRINAFQLFVDLVDSFDNVIFRTFHYEGPHNNAPRPIEPGDYCSTASIPANVLIEGAYRFVIRAANMYERMIEPQNGISLNVQVEEAGRFVRHIYQSQKGLVTLDVMWDTTLVTS